MDEIYSQLAQLLQPYGTIPVDSLIHVLENFTVQQLAPQEFLCKPGDDASWVGIQLSGILRTYIITSKGDERICDFCRPGDILDSSESQGPTPKWQQALEESTVATIDPVLFESLIDEDVHWQKITRLMMKSCLEDKSKREKELLSLDAMGKYQVFLRDFQDIHQRVPQYQIASYLGISPVSLSRIRSLPL